MGTVRERQGPVTMYDVAAALAELLDDFERSSAGIDAALDRLEDAVTRLEARVKAREETA